MKALTLVKSIPVLAIVSSSLILLAPKPSYGKDLVIRCNESTVLSGFKFTLNKCKGNSAQLAIANTYANPRKLGIEGNIIQSNGSLYHQDNSSRSIIDFPTKGTLVSQVNTGGYAGYGLNIFPAAITSKLIKSISTSCNDGTKKLAGVIFTIICTSKEPRFIVENTSNSTKTIASYGSRGNFNFRNYKEISPGSQHRFDLSAIATGKNVAAQKHRFEIRQ